MRRDYGRAHPTPAHPTPARQRAADRLLLALGADASFVDAVLGDLAEEHACRVERDGAGSARAWWVREVLRSAPHVLVNAVRHGGPRTRARLAAVGGGAALLAGVAAAALLARDGPPARLVAGSGGAGGIVVNNVRPVRLPVRVLDADGNVLDSAGVRFRWASGAPMDVTPAGVVTCAAPGDATVRASIGAVSADLLVRCRPVKQVRAAIWNDFVLGDPARELPVEFVGPDGAAVMEIGAWVGVDDSTVATMDGLRIRPLGPGRAHLSLTVGDEGTGAAIRVFAPARSLDEIRPDNRLVAVPLRLAPGAAERWPLPVGLFSLVFLPPRAAGAALAPAAPTLTVDGPIMCMPEPGPRTYGTRCLARAPGATVTIAHPGRTDREVTGALALEWEAER